MQIHKRPGAMIKQLHDEIERRANSLLRDQDLTMAQMNVLMELESAPERQLSLKELEHLLHVAQSTTAGIVARLEQKGFVECFAASDDRRVKLTRITSAGLACCADAEKNIHSTEARLLAPLTDGERAMFSELLERICEYL